MHNNIGSFFTTYKLFLYIIINMEEKKYSVYVHRVQTDNGPMYYVGMTNNIKRRWNSGQYMPKGKSKGTSLWPYIEKYGWGKIDHYIVAENLEYKQAKEYEDKWITSYREIGRCINHQRSGLISTKEDFSRFSRQVARKLYKRHLEDEKVEKKKNAYKGDKGYKEYQLNYMKNKLRSPEGKIYNRVNTFNRQHPDRAIETPKEAKNKYLATGYIPQYIKHDDL